MEKRISDNREYNYQEGVGINFSALNRSEHEIDNADSEKRKRDLYKITAEQEIEPQARLERMQKEARKIEKSLRLYVSKDEAKEISGQVLGLVRDIDSVIEQIKNFPGVRERFSYTGSQGFESLALRKTGFPKASVTLRDGLNEIIALNENETVEHFFKTVEYGPVLAGDAHESEPAKAFLKTIEDKLEVAKSILGRAEKRFGDIGGSMEDYTIVSQLSDGPVDVDQIKRLGITKTEAKRKSAEKRDKRILPFKKPDHGKTGHDEGGPEDENS